jgi:Zn-dependent M32 family carboxypeptidase
LQPAPKGYIAYGAKKGVVVPKKVIERIASGENIGRIAKEVRISKEAFANLRDEISNLYNKGYSGDVKGIINAMYNDAEKSGLNGMQQARGLWKEFQDFKSVKTNLSNLEKVDAFQVQKDLVSVISQPKNYKAMIDKYAPRMGVDKAQQLFNQALSVRHGKQAIKGALGLAALGYAGNKTMNVVGSLRKP